MTEPAKHIPVDYDDGKHLYSLQGMRYTSASQLVEKFGNHFDADTVAIGYAAKHGMTPEYWKDKWATKNEKSKIRGNNIHDQQELILKTRMLDIYDDRQVPVHDGLIQETDPWYNRPDGVYTEAKLWHHGYRLAGRSDKVILLTHYPVEFANPSETIQRYAHVEDYKTNESLNFESYQYPNGSRKMMKPPIAHIQDCNWQHYCLQLSIYMLMLEYQGFLPGKMSITHFPHPTSDNPIPKLVKYPVPYLKKEVVTMASFNLRSYATANNNRMQQTLSTGGGR